MRDDVTADILGCMRARTPVRHDVAAVVAHSDDETIGMGGIMPVFRNLALIQLTDSAPLDPAHVAATGFATRRDYAAARRAETVDALQVTIEGRYKRLACYEIPDGTLVDNLDVLVERLVEDLVWVEAVISHPFEGGHADHDVAAFAVRAACARLARAGGHVPVRLEFTSYHPFLGLPRTGRFIDRADRPEIAVDLTAEMARRKEAAFACYRTQKDNLRFFGFGPERFRGAPDYDFTAAPVADPMYGPGEWRRLASAFAAFLGREAGRVADEAGGIP